MQTPASASQMEFPYYPPESYPLLSSEDAPTIFREPTPELSAVPIPPPFQYSSSSLSAALEERPAFLGHSLFAEQTPMNISFAHTPESSSTSSPYTYAQEFYDSSMLLDDFSDQTQSITDRNTLPTYYSHHNADGLVPNDNGVCPAGPSRIEQHQPDTIDKSPDLSALSLPNQPLFFNESPLSFASPELSSAPSSPYGQTGISSIASSPATPAPMELSSESVPSQSLLFSQSIADDTAASTSAAKETSTRKQLQGPIRLSALLPLSECVNLLYQCAVLSLHQQYILTTICLW